MLKEEHENGSGIIRDIGLRTVCNRFAWKKLHLTEENKNRVRKPPLETRSR